MHSHSKSYTSHNGRDLVLAALRHEEVPAVPWIPFAGVHAGRLKGYTGQEILTDADKLFESLLEVNRIYQPDGLPVVFDLQIEAEILGCEMLWAEKAPPSVASHPFADRMGIPDRLPQKGDGRLPLVLDVMGRMKQAIGEQTALYGLVTGPFTLASHLRGTEIFMDTFDHCDYLQELLDYCKKACIQVADFYIEAGMDVIAVVDPVISQISPRMFKKFMEAPFSAVFDYIRERDVFSSFFVCGDATKNIEPMCQTAPDSIAIDENIDLVAAKQITDRYNITIEGNIPLASCMLLGTQQDNMKFVVDLLDSVGHHNLIVSPGCDMPYDVPPENAIGVAETIRNVEQARQLLTLYTAEELDLDQLVLPDYKNLSKPLVEVFTIDSATCPACGYMKLAAERAFAELDGKIDLQEYKATLPENIVRMKKMDIKNLPAMFINGELRFSSLIPSHRELMEAIQGHL